MRPFHFLAVALTCAAISSTSFAQAQDIDDPVGLAKQSQNPISSLVSIPFQFNFNGDIGSEERTQLILNIQPVIPINLSQDWLLVTRWIMPLVFQPVASARIGATFGFGDFNPEIFLAKQFGKSLTVGVGLAAILPTATNGLIGAGKLSLGPTAVAVWTQGPWVVGALANDVYSVAGDSTRTQVKSFLLQPFINFNLPNGVFIATAPVITADWMTNQWVVPLGLGVGKVLRLGDQMTNIGLQGYWNAVRPSNGASWQLRINFQLLFPTAQTSGAAPQPG